MSYMMRCPHCGKHLKADPAKAGQKVGCNACRKPFVHPGVDELTLRVKFAGDPATAAQQVAKSEAEAAALTGTANRRSIIGLAASLVCVVVVGGLLFAFRRRESAEAAGGAKSDAYAVVELGNPADLPSVEAILLSDRSFPLNLSNDVAQSGIEIDRTTNKAVLNYRAYQATGLHVAAEELRRLLAESKKAGRKPELIVARSGDGGSMLFLSKIHVTKPGTAGWMREVRDRLRLSPPFTIAAAIDVDDNLYLELTSDATQPAVGRRSD
jgi:hypothetical protein